ncbi:hypothetical protein DNTS_011029 [Danionella cerebrum]|uniref:TBC1 domain family member 30 n=1 Tax=Danionella cerebrum TaxID=2873325 RepID=A0A553PN01_9TELE|nr:hypothetical protein DNTS_011029 [Danionella translucida]
MTQDILSPGRPSDNLGCSSVRAAVLGRLWTGKPVIPAQRNMLHSSSFFIPILKQKKKDKEGWEAVGLLALLPCCAAAVAFQCVIHHMMVVRVFTRKDACPAWAAQRTGHKLGEKEWHRIQEGMNEELKEVDICDICSEESGVFVTSGVPYLDESSALHLWGSNNEPPASDESSRDTSGLPESASESPAGGRGVCSDEEDLRTSSLVECLLVELYDTYSQGGRGVDSSTEASSSDAFLGRSTVGSSFLLELQEKSTRSHQKKYLAQKAKLLRQLKRKDRLQHKLQKNCDILTACLQAASQKRRGPQVVVQMKQERAVSSKRSRVCVRRQNAPGGVGNVISNVLKKRSGISRRAPRLLCTLEPGVDTRLKFTIEPSLGKNGFQQWYDALKSVVRLPVGIPKEWRKRVWLTLADQYLHSISIDWEKTMRFAFNDRSNPDDDSLGIQIVKDLHRTGCSSYCGQEAEQDRVVLKRVLLAYARWNKTVGYCQGFNVLAALILEVTEGNEGDALKVMIHLIDKVLPESYFANNLRALSVDMAVFRDLLRMKLPELSQHLHHLQKLANREAGGSYEPPLTNVFTMQWFLTMFATCLPHHTVLKIWDSVFFEGSEMLLRVALAIWAKLEERIEECQSADEFYSTMGCLTQEMLEHNLIDSNELMQSVCCNISPGLPVEAETIKPHQSSSLQNHHPGTVHFGIFLKKHGKCPATNILTSQIGPSPVVNHLLLGRRMRTSRNSVIHNSGAPHSTSTPDEVPIVRSRHHSPWRTHVRAHRRNIARARAQLGFDDSLDVEDDQFSKWSKTPGDLRKKNEEQTEESVEKMEPGSSNVSRQEIQEIDSQMSSLELEPESSPNPSTVNSPEPEFEETVPSDPPSDLEVQTGLLISQERFFSHSCLQIISNSLGFAKDKA